MAVGSGEGAATVSGSGVSTVAVSGSAVGIAVVTGDAVSQATQTTGSAVGVATVEGVGKKMTVWDKSRLMITDIEATLIPAQQGREYRSRR